MSDMMGSVRWNEFRDSLEAADQDAHVSLSFAASAVYAACHGYCDEVDVESGEWIRIYRALDRRYGPEGPYVFQVLRKMEEYPRRPRQPGQGERQDSE